MLYSVDVSYSVDKDSWDSKLLENASSTIYQSYNWSEIYKNLYNSKPVFFIMKDEEGKVVAQLLSFIHSKYYWANSPLVIQKINSLLNLGSILFWWYGPVIHDQKNQLEIIEKLFYSVESFARKKKLFMIKGSFPPLLHFNDKSLLDKFQYNIIPWSTYIINLNQNSIDFFSKLDKKIRYDIRKAEDNNHIFIISNKREDLTEYGLIKDTYVKAIPKNNEDSSRIFYDDHWNFLQKYGYEKLFRVLIKDKTESAALVGIFNKNIVQHGVASLKNDSKAGSFLTWNMIKWGMESNYHILDLGGANPEPQSNKEEKIDFFKSKWNGEKIEYLRFFKILNLWPFLLSKLMMNPRSILNFHKVLSKILKLHNT